MALSTQYHFLQNQKKWHAHWERQGLFTSKNHPTSAPYTIIMPPPNVTGILHLGHVLNSTLQDILIRKARMQGKQTSWLPGLDHAAIATEAKVVEMLKAKGLNKQDLTREAFLKHAMQWKEKYGSLILKQLKELGLSCDWSHTHFTLDPHMQQAVKKAFLTLYQKGYIYRSKRMIHWDPKGQTALADEEVIYKQVQGHLYYIQYNLVNQQHTLTIATTRPETLLGDTAIAVHPEDPRYTHLQGQKAYLPLRNRIIPIIADSYVDQKIGTGCLKVTPAHDANDYEIALRHNLPMIDIFNPNGTLSPAAGLYIGEEINIARKKIVKALQEKGHLVKIVPHTHQVGFSERTQAIVEPKCTTQWFVKMKKLAEPALEALQKGHIHFYPNKFQNLYTHWMENIKDWCISRQLWWGHRLPVYHLPDQRFVVAENPQQALAKARKLMQNPQLTPKDIVQDQDVLDTWFSAWLWPITLFEGIQKPNNPTFSYRYPTDDLVTAPDIIFFWVARMIMAGYAFTGKPPFKNVYFTGLVRDSKGQKMSKSLGNSPDPIDLIKKYGTDSLRAGMLFCAPAGNDLLFEEKLCEQGSRFVHKIWNALRLIKSWQVTDQKEAAIDQKAISWFQARYQKILAQVNTHFAQFRISEALILIYKLIWDDFCAYYLEMIKPLQNKHIARTTYQATTTLFANLMKLLHPFMPFVTEEINHQLHEEKAQKALAFAKWPIQKSIDQAVLTQAEHAFALITAIRHIKKQHQWAIKKQVDLHIQGQKPIWFIHFEPYIKKATGIERVHMASSQPGPSCMVSNCTFSLPDIKQNAQSTNHPQLAKKLQEVTLLLAKINQKLNNAAFVQNAPDHIVAYERKKRTEAEATRKSLQDLLSK
ncbi:MAG: valine--tRNA ligase [Bacteroidota bacterium]